MTVAYCHCADCRRVTGAAVAAFVAFSDDVLTVAPDHPRVSHATGVERQFCPDCGSPLTARFSYLPGQVYVPLGVLDQTDALAPEVHCHDGARPAWLHIEDDLPRDGGSARAVLNEAGA